LQQVFNCDKTGLFWKRMPRRTCIMKDTIMPGHKTMKDRLTLLFCANASGDCKVKPLLLYQSENSRALKTSGKTTLEFCCVPTTRTAWLWCLVPLSMTTLGRRIFHRRFFWSWTMLQPTLLI